MDDRKKTPDICLRVATKADEGSIARLVNDAFRLERLIFTTEDRTNPEEVRNMVDKGEFPLAEDGAALVGCVYLEPRGERCYLGMLSVEPARRRSGLGTCLMTAAEDHCRATRARGVDIQIVNLRKELPDIVWDTWRSAQPHSPLMQRLANPATSSSCRRNWINRVEDSHTRNTLPARD